ncbi:MAG: hypothetical protein V3R81_07255 [Gammaproteobacteria bacterium]
MSWLGRLLARRTESNPPTSATRRPLYIPYDAPKNTASEDQDKAQKLAELRLLQDSTLADQKVDDANFDPYNTGAFNRSRSWDKISKQKNR